VVRIMYFKPGTWVRPSITDRRLHDTYFRAVVVNMNQIFEVKECSSFNYIIIPGYGLWKAMYPDVISCIPPKEEWFE